MGENANFITCIKQLYFFFFLMMEVKNILKQNRNPKH